MKKFKIILLSLFIVLQPSRILSMNFYPVTVTGFLGGGAVYLGYKFGLKPYLDKKKMIDASFHGGECVDPDENVGDLVNEFCHNGRIDLDKFKLVLNKVKNLKKDVIAKFIMHKKVLGAVSSAAVRGHIEIVKDAFAIAKENLEKPALAKFIMHEEILWAVHWAAVDGHFEVVEGAFAIAKENLDETALAKFIMDKEILKAVKLAACNGHIEIAKFILTTAKENLDETALAKFVMDKEILKAVNWAARRRRIEVVVYLINQGVRLSDDWINENTVVYNDPGGATEDAKTFLKKIYGYVESENKVDFIRTEVINLSNENLKSDLLEIILLFECAVPALDVSTSILTDHDIRNQIIPQQKDRKDIFVDVLKHLCEKEYFHAFENVLNYMPSTVFNKNGFKTFTKKLVSNFEGKADNVKARDSKCSLIIEKCKKEFNRKEKLKSPCLRDCLVLCE